MRNKRVCFAVYVYIPIALQIFFIPLISNFATAICIMFACAARKR